ncbi:MAG: site-2 protease family protein [Patescibacteria group bacterium]
MMLSLLFQQPILFIAWAAAIIIGITIHEFSHALAGVWQGDPTAKVSGRLTLNPLAHLSGVGFIMLLLVGFGWGKPVPFNPYNLKSKRWGPSIISLAGPASNLIMAVSAGGILKTLVTYTDLPSENLLLQFLNLLVIISLVLMIFNLIPIPPLDGSKVLFSVLDAPKYSHFKTWLSVKGPLVLVSVIFLDYLFNVNLFGGLFQLIINSVYKFIY